MAIKSGISHLQQLNHAKSTSRARRLLFCPLEQNAPPKTNIEFELAPTSFFYCRSAKAPEQATFITFVLTDLIPFYRRTPLICPNAKASGCHYAGLWGEQFSFFAKFSRGESLNVGLLALSGRRHTLWRYARPPERGQKFSFRRARKPISLNKGHIRQPGRCEYKKTRKQSGMEEKSREMNMAEKESRGRIST